MNKVLACKDNFEDKGFFPKISLALKASRTIFCSGFDPVLLMTYNKETINEYLESKGWKVMDIYIFKNNTSFKLEFESKEIASKFLNSNNTDIGGIKILQEHKETEVDRTIKQCWTCGLINTDHSSQNCSGQQQCLTCGDTEHTFFNCPLPKSFKDMTTDQQNARFCIPCGIRGNHTTLDPFCPKKRVIIQKRIKEAREKRKENQEAQDIACNRLQNAFDFSNTINWPTINTTKQHTKISTILMLTLLDEAVSKGSFQSNLSKACHDNDLPNIIYTPHPNTATALFDSMTEFSDCSCTPRPTHLRKNMKKQTTKKAKTCSLTKYTRDQSKRQGEIFNTLDFTFIHKEEINNCMKQGMSVDEALETTKNKDYIAQSSITDKGQPNCVNDISIRPIREITQDINHLTPESLQSLNSNDITYKQLIDHSDLSDISNRQSRIK